MELYRDEVTIVADNLQVIRAGLHQLHHLRDQPRHHRNSNENKTHPY